MTALVSLDSVSGTDARAPSTTVLEVLDGLHQGVSLPLDKAVYRVGSCADTDIILSDAGIAEQHLVLRLAGAQLAVEAVGGEVTLVGPDGRPLLLKQGLGQRLLLPTELRIGHARLRLRDTRPAPLMNTEPGLRLTSRQWAIVAAVLLMALCTLAYAFRDDPASPAYSVPPARSAATSPVAPTVEQAHAWLTHALSDAELAHLQTRINGRQISVEGSYPAALKDRWLGVQQTFDSRFGQHVVLTPKVQATASVAKPRVRFQAVWLGTHPYVIDEHGKRLYPGATLTDNWVLDAIESDEVRLTRGHERFVFTL